MSEKKDTIKPDESLADMIDDPIEVKVEPHGQAEVDVDATGRDEEGLGIEIHAGQHADVTVNVEKADPSGESLKGDDQALVIPKWVRVVLNPFAVLTLMLLPVGAWLFVSDSSPRGFMGLMTLSVVGWLVLMVALYEWARSYYKYISKSVGRAEGVEIVSAVAGGLSEAFPAAIIALGIGGTAAYLENRYHDNELLITQENHQHEMLMQDMQWQREQAGALLESLNSEGYATIYIAKSMMERLVWMQIMDRQAVGGIGPDGFKQDAQGQPLKAGVAELSYRDILNQYDVLNEDYANGSTLESVLSAIKIHFSSEKSSAPEYRDSEQHQEARANILDHVERAEAKLSDVWSYYLTPLESKDGKRPTELDLDDSELFTRLYQLSSACETEIDLLSRAVRIYVSMEHADEK